MILKSGFAPVETVGSTQLGEFLLQDRVEVDQTTRVPQQLNTVLDKSASIRFMFMDALNFPKPAQSRVSPSAGLSTKE